MQAPASDLSCISMICEILAAAAKLPSSTPALTADAQQQLRVAASGLIKLLGIAFAVLADELQQQQQQQQRPAQGMRSGFLGSSTGRRQQQQQSAPHLHPGLALARALLTLWQSLALQDLTEASMAALFNNAAKCATLLPAVKLMLVILQAQDCYAAGSSISSSGAAVAGQQLYQMQSALTCAVNLAQAIVAGPVQHTQLRSEPAVQQLLAAPELHQLLVVTAAWLTGLLHQQQQGRAAVDAAAVVRALGNSSAAATYALDSSCSSSSGGGGGGGDEVPPHHSSVLHLLGVSAVDPCPPTHPVSSQQARDYNSSTLQRLDEYLPAVLQAAGVCLEISSDLLLTSQDPAAASSTSYYSCKLGGSSSSSTTWQQVLPALLRMLLQLVRLGPNPCTLAAAMAVAMPAVLMDVPVWQQPAAAAAVTDWVMQLGPVMLHAAQQQQQQDRQDAVDCQYALWGWALAAANAVGAAKPEHLAAAIKKSPEAFAVSLCAALRVMSAATCSRASQTAAAAAAAACASTPGVGPVHPAGLDVLSLLPLELTTALPPGALLSVVNQVTEVALAALMHANVVMTTPFPALPGSSSSSQGLRQQHVPFVVSLMLTALKCASALRGTCPRQALAVASTVGRYRLDEINPVTAVHESSAEAGILVTGRHIGRHAAAAVIAAGPLVTFRPGGRDNGSSGGSSSRSSAAWYTEQMSHMATPWVTVAARSMWLIGQVLSELLPASSRSSSSSALLLKRKGHHRTVMATSSAVEEVDEGVFRQLLEMAYPCVEWLGAQLCHMHLPGDEVPTRNSSSSSSSSSAEDLVASMPLLAQLLQQHAQLQAGLYAAVQRCAAAELLGEAQHDMRSTSAAPPVQRVWGDALPGQLKAFGAAVAAAMPVGWACNNAACTNLGKLSEQQLVHGRGKVCRGCRQVRMCSAECQKQHWKAGHKLVCKKLAAGAAAAAGDCHSTAASDQSTGRSGSVAACSSGSSGAAGAAAAIAGLELPGSAAAAAALPVRQL
uniref:MYND-type domain-containing protein n=1 Tax=Tetradesmus obliquus TaxID=3088 RepID=A0A383VPZ3_TETOB|eukprot:jgi/Sobl393_1/2552/SZX67585.1